VLILDMACEVVASANFPLAEVAYDLLLAFLVVDCPHMATKILFEGEGLRAHSVGHVTYTCEGLLMWTMD
jgi:hypothetical protein